MYILTAVINFVKIYTIEINENIIGVVLMFIFESVLYYVS
jgi:hypothetical protein